MRIVKLSYIILLLWGMGETQGAYLGSEMFDFQKLSGTNLRSSSSTSWSFDLCHKAKLYSKSPDTHLACNSECLTLQSELSTIHQSHSNKLIGYLYNKCGMVTGGHCTTVARFPTCMCQTPTASEGLLRTSIPVCRFGVQLLRIFSKNVMTASSERFDKDKKKRVNEEMGNGVIESVAMSTFPRRPRSGLPAALPGSSQVSGTSRSSHRVIRPTPIRPGAVPYERPASPPSNWSPSHRHPTRSRNYYPSVVTDPPPLEEGGVFDVLWTTVRLKGRNVQAMVDTTTVRLKGRNVQAMVDTGAGFSMINRKLVNTFDACPERYFTTANNQLNKIHGQTRVDLEIRPGVKVLLTGLIADHPADIVFGSDFFAAYAVKINISTMQMQIDTGLSIETLPLEFSPVYFMASMMNVGSSEFTSLYISVRLNGYIVKIDLDTGSSLSMINRKHVAPQSIRHTNTHISFAGNALENLTEATDANIWIKSKNFEFHACIANLQDDIHLIAGVNFVKKYVDVINYTEKSVTLKVPGSNKISTTAIFERD